MPREHHAGAMVTKREIESYQCPRIEGDNVCGNGIVQELVSNSYSSPIGQQGIGCSNKQVGGTQVTSTVPNHQGFLGCLPLATDHNYCRPCPRSPEPNSRSGIPGFSGKELLDVEQVIFATNREDMGRGRYSSICGPTDNPEEGLCQLETRSKGSENGCIHNAVDRPNKCMRSPHFVWWVFA